jgi:5-methylcytosine-specific restriction protein A
MTAETRTVYNARWRRVRREVLERDGWLCQIRGPKCLIRADRADHIIPWRQGGAYYDPANLRASCKPCNEGRVFRGVGQRHPSREW